MSLRDVWHWRKDPTKKHKRKLERKKKTVFRVIRWKTQIPYLISDAWHKRWREEKKKGSIEFLRMEKVYVWRKIGEKYEYKRKDIITS
jgi:hypothetical protein